MKHRQDTARFMGNRLSQSDCHVETGKE